MGRYFGIANKTKQHKVSAGKRCWKALDFCDCHELMHRYHWDPTDDIYSACYDTYTEFRYDDKNNIMETYDPELERMAKNMKQKSVKEENQLRQNIKLFLENPDKLKKVIGYGIRLNVDHLFYTPDFIYETVKSFLEIADKVPTSEYLEKLGGFIHQRIHNEPGYFQCTFTTYVMNNPDENSTFSKNMKYILDSYQLDNKESSYMYSDNLPHYNINQIIEACTYYGFKDENHDDYGYLNISDDESSDPESDNETVNEKLKERIDIYTKLGYHPEDEMEKQADHVPKWNVNICTVCNYEFNGQHIDYDSKKFDKVFFMS